MVLSFAGHLPTSCRDIQVISGSQADGEQFLNIQGKALKVRYLIT